MSRCLFETAITSYKASWGKLRKAIQNQRILEDEIKKKKNAEMDSIKIDTHKIEY
jgi:hypothetical protein